MADVKGYDDSESSSPTVPSWRRLAPPPTGGRTWSGLEHLFSCTPEAFRAAAELAEEFDTGIYTHSSETICEVQESLSRFGRRPIEEMFDRGILGPQTVIAHCVWLDDRELALLAQTGTSVAHCPCST